MTSLKKYSTRLHTAEAAMLLALGISLCLAVWGGAQSSQLSQKLVRLHVVAASDEQYEQELKLRVRDAVLDFAEPLLSDASSAGEARATLLENLDGIKAAAESAAEGRPVSVTLREENYPTRRYEDFSLPAGRYSSLRVVLGDGRGQNWWCVVFPPLCTSAVTEPAGGLTDDDMRVIALDGSGYVLRFRAMELWGELRDLFDGD